MCSVLVDTFRTYPYFEMRTQTGKLPMQVRASSHSQTHVTSSGRLLTCVCPCV